MPRVNRIIIDNVDKIRTLCASRKVKSMFAFGSVCTDRFSPTSDIDLLIASQLYQQLLLPLLKHSGYLQLPPERFDITL